jgi:hypothetical protein
MTPLDPAGNRRNVSLVARRYLDRGSFPVRLTAVRRSTRSSPKIKVRSLLALSMLWAGAAAGAQNDEWNFTVYLDDSRIGHHRFRLSDRGDEAGLESEARFDVKLLFLHLYAYEHEARESWRGDCLQRLEAETDDNGKPHRVRGARAENGFVIENGDDRRVLPECVMTFAYWNPRFRAQRRLLNPQTGDYLDVRIEPAGRDEIAVRGQMVEAERYVLRAEKLEIVLWYSKDDRWLALDSMAGGGRRLRYRIE